MKGKNMHGNYLKKKQKENILNLITIAPVGAYFIFIFIE